MVLSHAAALCRMRGLLDWLDCKSQTFEKMRNCQTSLPPIFLTSLSSLIWHHEHKCYLMAVNMPTGQMERYNCCGYM